MGKSTRERRPNTGRPSREHRPSKAPQTRGALLFEDIPVWMQVDPRIRRGYREELRTLWNCILSLFYVHNEFVNIWSHFAPALIHLFLLVRGARGAFDDNGKNDLSAMDTAMVQLYILSAIACLLSSSAYHILKAHSERVARDVLKMDYLGIVLNIGIISITSTWFGLREQPYLRTFYITSSVGLSGLVFYILLGPRNDGPSSALWRSMLFGAFIASGYLPMVHNYLLYGEAGLRYFPLAAALAMNVLDFLGAAFYVSRFPESHFPHTFDIWGASHQIFHVLVMLGQIVFLSGLRRVSVLP